MAVLKILALLMMIALVPVMCASPSGEAQQGLKSDSGTRGIFDNIIEDQLRKALEKYEGLFIPALPTLTLDIDDYVSLALSLANLRLTGISEVNVLNSEVKGDHVAVNFTLPKINLDVGHYSSGGHMLNLPFSGEGPLLIALHKLRFNIHLSTSSNDDGKYCARSNSLQLSLDLRRLEVEFTNMNPDSDQGQLINIILSSFGPDIIDYLNILLNNKFHKVADDIFVDLVNTISCPGWVSNSPLNDKERIAQYLGDIFQHYKEVLKVPKAGAYI